MGRHRKAHDQSNQAREVMKVAKKTSSLGLQIRATQRPACATKPLQLADWLSRFVDEVDMLSIFKVKVTQLAGIKFKLPRLLTTLPNGRYAGIRCKGQPLREKLGFNFRDLFVIPVCGGKMQVAQGTKRNVSNSLHQGILFLIGEQADMAFLVYGRSVPTIVKMIKVAK